MSIYALKPRFQAVLRPMVLQLCRLGVRANQVTLVAMIGSCLLGALLALKVTEPVWFWLVPLWMFVRMALNAIDGMLAREHDQQSVLGAYLNELGDMVSDAALFLPFALIPNICGMLVVLVVMLALVSEAAGILGQVYGNGRHYDGPMGKSDRAVALGVAAVIYAIWPKIAWPLNVIMAVVIVLLLLTIVRRIHRAI
ncbi:CDP-alcohol phosphatidyltransferase family protein [Cardiobacteriaceae bacterium TAE3-ERU3]|nr:CDP-alcohol phosphatidyltransferase family protein [Cardiobacteriaceae bacterium TAE3-ERU3]